MCDQTEVTYKEGDIVWVKLGSFFWPGEVKDVKKLDEEILTSFKKPPIAAVKFFDEDKYEYVKNLNQICLYNCRKKHEYIKKGLDMYRKQKEGSYMDKFPDDVRRAESQTGGDPDILSDPQFVPQEKANYQGLFGAKKKVKGSPEKQDLPVARNGRKSLQSPSVRTPPRRVSITHPRFLKDEAEHKVHIRQQPVLSPAKKDSTTPPSTTKEAAYKCQLCDFTSNRLNVIVLHNKFHSATQTPTNNSKGKSKAKAASSNAKPRVSTTNVKSKTKSPSKELEVVPLSTNTNTESTVTSPPRGTPIKRKLLVETTAEIEKKRKPAEEVVAPSPVEKSPVKKQPKSPEKPRDSPASSGKRKSLRGGEEKVSKKVKNNEEIREKLLADWDDEDAEQEEKEIELLKQKLLRGENENVSDTNEMENNTQTTTNGNEVKAVSCFDFDDSKDSLLDTELEERAKKFVENRKISRVVDEKTEKLDTEIKGKSLESPPGQAITVSATEDSTPGEEFDKAIDNLLAETAPPQIPLCLTAMSEPCKSSTLLPDVVLDSNLAASSESKVSVVCLSTAPVESRGDHDYSTKGEEMSTVNDPIIDEEDFLDINSMPVVMADDVITDEPSTSQVPVITHMPKIDLIPNPNASNTHTIAMSDGRLAMSPSVQSVVQAVRGSTTDRSKMSTKTIVSVTQVGGRMPSVSSARATSNVAATVRVQSSNKVAPSRSTKLLQQGIASGKYVIVQSASNSQPKLTPIPSVQPKVSVKTISSSPQPQHIGLQPPGTGKVVIITKPHSGGQQQVLTALTPAQQKALISGGKLPPPQRLMTSTGQLLTPVNPKTVIAKGTKITPISGQQIRTVTGKQMLGPKLQMQSLQTKIILPTMENVKMSPGQLQPTGRMLNTVKGQSSTILIQATQSSSVLSSIVSKVSTAATQPTSRLTSHPKQQRPRLSTNAMLQQVLGKPTQSMTSKTKTQQTKTAFQPRMLLQKPRPTTVVGVKNDAQITPQAPRLVPCAPNVTGQVQVSKQVISAGRQIPHLVQKPRQTKPLVTSKSKGSTIYQPARTTQISSLHTNLSTGSPSSNIERLTAQPLPPLTPLHLTASSSNEVLPLSQNSTMSLSSFQTNLSEQLVPTSTAAPPTYVLLTIDEAGNLQPYNSQSLISYDGSNQPGQALYIDSSSLESGGDLDNLILTIDNTSSLALDMGQTNTMTSVSSIYNQRPASSSQDILAAALANTDVFQSDVSIQDPLTVVNTNQTVGMAPCIVQSSVPSLLLPSMNRPADVSETSLTLNQPIMTPLEVPSSVVPGHIPYTMEMPLTVTQSMSVPVSSYATTNENVPTTESIFQPSMPLLSEEIVDVPVTASVDTAHEPLPFDAISDTDRLIYQTHLTSQKSEDQQNTTQTIDTNEEHSSGNASLAKCSLPLPVKIAEGTGGFLPHEETDKSDFFSTTSTESVNKTNSFVSTVIDSADVCKVSEALPSSILSTQSQEQQEPTEIAKPDSDLTESDLFIKENSDKFLNTNTKSDDSSQLSSNHLINEDVVENNVEMAANITPQNIERTLNVSEENISLADELNVLKSNLTKFPHDKNNTCSSVSNVPGEAPFMLVANKTATNEPSLMESELGSDILENFLEIPQTSSKDPEGETSISTQSMPTLSEDSTFSTTSTSISKVEELVEQNDSQDEHDSSANVIGLETSQT